MKIILMIGLFAISFFCFFKAVVHYNAHKKAKKTFLEDGIAPPDYFYLFQLGLVFAFFGIKLLDEVITLF